MDDGDSESFVDEYFLVELQSQSPAERIFIMPGEARVSIADDEGT